MGNREHIQTDTKRTEPEKSESAPQSSRASVSSITSSMVGGGSLAVESPSPRHKRKPSVRAMGKNFMEKVGRAVQDHNVDEIQDLD